MEMGGKYFPNNKLGLAGSQRDRHGRHHGGGDGEL
jgi:hypothetical protein